MAALTTAYSESPINITLAASGTLATKQFYGVKVDTNSQVAVAGYNDNVIGVLQNNPDAAGKPCTITVGGVCKAIAGGTISPGDRVTVDTNGKFVSVSSVDAYILGTALTAGASGSIFALLIQHRGLNT